MVDRIVRNLAHLDEGASTSRVLNLLRVHRRHGRDAAYQERPFFRNPALNKALIVKHRLRRQEREMLLGPQRTATKIIIPIDGEDLKLGGRYAFVGQINFEGVMAETLGDGWRLDRTDRDLLMLIDRLPSLDPFLLREQVRRHGREPAHCYFDISDADMARMFKFVEREIQRLVDLSYKGGPKGAAEQEGGVADDKRSARLVKKILSSAVDAETEPLRLTLRLDKAEYQEGVFCWKGFLYYKWTLVEQLAGVSRVAEAILRIRPRGAAEPETLAQLDKSRVALHAAILKALEGARASLRFYDEAYDRLLGGEPQAFRNFLLEAPAMFCDLGERLGGVSHIASYWKYRFPSERMPIVAPDELADIVADFHESLALASQTSQPAAELVL